MNKVSLFADIESLNKKAAELIVELSRKTIENTGRFSIALSGGKTPALLYNLLAHMPYCEQLQWKNIFVFWSDERCVPPDDEENNSNMARKMLLDHVPIPAENIFAVQVQMPPAKAAIQYGQMLKAFFKEDIPAFDLILLGMGADGHTASLFPGTEALWRTSPELAQAVEAPGAKMQRITFTPRLINNAKHILILVTGENKAAVLQKVLEDKNKEVPYPAQYIKPVNGKLWWFVDAAAASKLKHK
jgi:6-phosphogluconolactonase